MATNISDTITVELPERATIFELAMTSANDGWLVGAVFASDAETLQSGLIMRLHDHAWRPIDDPLPVAFVDGIAMISPDEGWATGFSQDKTRSYLLRYSGGHWRQVPAPFQPTDGKYYGGVRMLSPDEGWIVVNSASSWRGQIESLLLHYHNGSWTPVSVPTPVVWDFAPVGPDDLWLVGNASTLTTLRRDSTIAHFQQGQWDAIPAPGHVLLGALRMQSSSTGYATGWQPYLPYPGGPSQPPAVMLAYDGTAWAPMLTGADPAAQEIHLLDHTDAWAVTKSPSNSPYGPSPNDVISAVPHTTGALDQSWPTVDWPFTDIIHLSAIVRAAPGEYWAAAQYQTLPLVAGAFHWELLHFASGAWREYPSR